MARGDRHCHDLSPGTHTPELQQVHELNERLSEQIGAGTGVTAADLGLTGHPVEGTGAPFSAGGLPADAVLDHLSAQGPPDFPYITGYFRTAPNVGPDRAAEPLPQIGMHTATLLRLSRILCCRHVWGA